MCACVRCAYCETRDERKSNSGSRTNVCHSLESLCLLCVMCAHEMALQPAWTSPNLNFQTVAHLYIIIMGMINHKKGKADVHRPIRYHTKREKRSECASLPSLPFSFTQYDRKLNVTFILVVVTDGIHKLFRKLKLKCPSGGHKMLAALFNLNNSLNKTILYYISRIFHRKWTHIIALHTAQHSTHAQRIWVYNSHSQPLEIHFNPLWVARIIIITFSVSLARSMPISFAHTPPVAWKYKMIFILLLYFLSFLGGYVVRLK